MQDPETQLFLYDLLLMKLVDDGDLKNVNYPNKVTIISGKRIWRFHLYETKKCESENFSQSCG
jgi:hypothetical protein